MEQSELAAEIHALREILKKKETQLQCIKAVTAKLLSAYIGTLQKGGAALAASRETNPLIAETEDFLSLDI